MTAQQPIASPKRLTFTVDHFVTLSEAGIFDGLRKVELLEGRFFHCGQPWKLDKRAFETLAATGAFANWKKTELIEGEVYGMNAQRARHAIVKSRLALRLGNALHAIGSHYEAITEVTIDMRPDSLPEPDIVVASARLTDGYVGLASVRIVVEVSDSSLAHDLKRKSLIYADRGIEEYWVVDLARSVVHQLAAPIDGRYENRQEVRFGDRLQSNVMPDLMIETSGLE